jgi:tripartite-type tricarboxylate transporter receptor subunit TctC
MARIVDRRLFCLMVAGSMATTAASFAVPTNATAQTIWPTKPVRIVVTFPPGGTSDIVARLLGQYMSEKLGQQFVIDNRPGAGGTLAADIVRKEAADGHTLILANNAPFTISPTQFKTVPYDTVRDFTHISYIGASPPALFVQPSSGMKTIADFIAKAKAEPGKLNYGSSGVGSIHHVLGEALKRRAGINVVHIPYRGTAPAIQDFKAGVLQTYYDLLAQNVPMIKAGEAIAIGVAAPARISQAPDVPTFREQGIDLVLENWLGISGPAGMPPAVVDAINKAVQDAMALPAVQERLQTWGIERKTLNSAEYAAFVADQIQVWRPLIIEAGAQEK